MKRPRAVIVTTAPQTLRAFFLQQIRDLAHAGFDIQAISSAGRDLDACREELGIPVHMVPMMRRISPFRDAIALWKLIRTLRAIGPDIVQTHTPKAGLLGMIASVLTGVPIRIYTVNGLVWESATGLRRFVLGRMDRIAAALSTRVLCVSESVRKVMVSAGVCRAERAAVLGSGGSHGVSLEKFDPSRFTDLQRQEIRQRNGLPADGRVVAFVGRFVADKGIELLLESWLRVREQVADAILLLIGERESSHPIPESLWARVTDDPRIVVSQALPHEMPAICSIPDILVLPTRREGLPNALLEAGAMQVPVVATRVTGCVDVVVEDRTGFLIEASPDQLADRVVRLLRDSELRRQMGDEARRHIALHFSEQNVSGRLAQEYWRLLGECGYPVNSSPDPVPVRAR